MKTGSCSAARTQGWICGCQPRKWQHKRRGRLGGLLRWRSDIMRRRAQARRLRTPVQMGFSILCSRQCTSGCLVVDRSVQPLLTISATSR